MAYVRKIIAQEEKLVGIARLHWIYVIKGLCWFLGLSLMGWGIDKLMTYSLFVIAQSTGATGVSSMLMSFSRNIMLFLMVGGVFLFLQFVLKVLVTEVALTSRRIIHKQGLIFVKVQQIDIEEIRGENMDTGHLGRLLGYAYIMLDCRFIGDIRLPAIESAERFMRALHETRGIAQDTLNVVLGKNNPMAVGIVGASEGGPDTPQPQTPKPTPEIQPGQQPAQPEVNPPNTPQPEIQPPPVPHSPPPNPAPPQQPQTPPAQPPQPTPPPINPEPPLQPPSGGNALEGGGAPKIELPPEAVAQVVRQVMPQMAEQVVREMAEQGLIKSDTAANDDIDTDLMDSFDEARLQKGEGGDDLRDKMEYAIH